MSMLTDESIALFRDLEGPVPGVRRDIKSELLGFCGMLPQIIRDLEFDRYEGRHAWKTLPKAIEVMEQHRRFYSLKNFLAEVKDVATNIIVRSDWENWPADDRVQPVLSLPVMKHFTRAEIDVMAHNREHFGKSGYKLGIWQIMEGKTPQPRTERKDDQDLLRELVYGIST